MNTNRNSVLIAGNGNTGSPTAILTARNPAITRVALVDPDVVVEKNLFSQHFQRADLGRPKVEVMRDRLLAIRPDLTVLAYQKRLEALAAGLFRGIVLSCVDSNGPRQVIAELTWQAGGRLLDCAVNAEAGLVRITEVGEGDECACLECGWAAEYETLPVQNSCQDAPPTNAPAALGSLVASLAALRIQENGQHRTASTTELVASSSRMFRSTLERNPNCRFDHRRLARVEFFGEFDPDRTIGSLFDQLQCEELKLFHHPWDRRLRCPACGHLCETLKAGRDPLAEPCSFCGHFMERIGFYAVPSVRKTRLPANLLTRSLREVGLQPGEIVVPDHAPQGFQLGDPFHAITASPEPSLTR